MSGQLMNIVQRLPAKESRKGSKKMQRVIKDIRCPNMKKKTQNANLDFFFLYSISKSYCVFLFWCLLATKCFMFGSSGPRASSDPLSPDIRKTKQKKRKIIQTVSSRSQAAANGKKKKKDQSALLAVSETLALAVVGRNELELRRGSGEQAGKRRRIPSCTFVI